MAAGRGRDVGTPMGQDLGGPGVTPGERHGATRVDRSAYRTADEVLAHRIYRVLGAVLAVSVALVVLGSASLGWRWDWTGFPDNGTWWAWFSLLVLPVVIVVLPVWLKTRARHSALWRLGLVAAAAVSLVVIMGGYTFGWSWVGFYRTDTDGGTVRLWDWLTLLVQPVALALLPFWLGLKRGITTTMTMLAGAVGILFSVLVICGYAVPWDWTGFAGNKLWDWIKDLVVPFALPVALILLDPEALSSAAGPTPEPAGQDAGGADRGRRAGLRVPMSMTVMGMVGVLVLGGVGVWLSPLAHRGMAKSAAHSTGGGSATGFGRDGGSTPQTAGNKQKNQSLRWQSVSGPTGHSISGSSAAVFRGQIWIAGGTSTAVYVYDPRTERWHAGPRLPAPQRLGAMASDGQTLYSIGGISPDERRGLPTVYQLDSPNGAWRPGPPLPAGRFSGAAAWDGHRIVFGGGAADSDLRHRAPASEIWALTSTGWGQISKLPNAREHLAAATDGSGTVWFVGGTDVPAGPGGLSAEVDVLRNSDTTPAGSLPEAVQGLSAVWTPTWGICAIGGATSQPNVQPTVRIAEASCLPGGSWPRLPQAAYLPTAVTLSDTVYVIAGAHMYILRLPQ
jgi:Kelch motif